MATEGWVKNYRKIAEWEWYTTPNMAHLFQHLIRSASHCDTRWQGVEIKNGQVVIGLPSLSSATGVSIRGIRTCLTRLEQSGEIVKKSTNRFTILTICKYEEYQQDDKPRRQASDRQATGKRQANDNIQECKELKNVKKSVEKNTYGEFRNVFLSDVELKTLSEKFNGTLENRINRLSAYLASSGKEYKSHYATIVKWYMDETTSSKKESEWQ